MCSWSNFFSPFTTCRILRPLSIEFKPVTAEHNPSCRCSGGQLPILCPQSGGLFSKLENSDPNGPRADVDAFIFPFWNPSCSLCFGHKRVIFPQEFLCVVVENRLVGELALERKLSCLVFSSVAGLSLLLLGITAWYWRGLWSWAGTHKTILSDHQQLLQRFPAPPSPLRRPLCLCIFRVPSRRCVCGGF